jgi:rod shape-determining protein MreD
MQVKDTNKNRRDVTMLAIVCLVLQLTVAPNIALGNGHINFALVFAGVVALTRGGRIGVICGFVAGMVFDLLGTGPMGVMSMLLTIASYLMGIEVRNRLAEDLSGSMIVYVMSAVGVCLLHNLTMFLVGQATDLVDVLFLRSLPSALLSILAFLPFAYLISRSGSNSGLGAGIGSSRPKHSGKYNIGGV